MCIQYKDYTLRQYEQPFHNTGTGTCTYTATEFAYLEYQRVQHLLLVRMQVRVLPRRMASATPYIPTRTGCTSISTSTQVYCRTADGSQANETVSAHCSSQLRVDLMQKSISLSIASDPPRRSMAHMAFIFPELDVLVPGFPARTKVFNSPGSQGHVRGG